MDKYYLRLLGSVSNSRGLTLQFKEQPPLSPVPIPLSNTQDPQKFLLLSTEVETLLTKRAVEEVPVSSIDPGFYSRLFLVSKKTGGMRPVIDLSILNSYMIIPHFKMETNRSIRASILPGMWTTSLDLTDAYFHVPVCHSYRKFLRFVWNKRVYQFRALPFGLSTAPLAFTKLMQVAIAQLHSQAIQIHSYLDDSLIKELSPEKLYLNTDVVIRLLFLSGVFISWKKSDLIPSQDFIFLGEHYLTRQCIVRPPQEKFQNLCSKIRLFLSQKTVTARQFSQLLGLLNSLADVVPLLQFYLHQHWLTATQDWEFPVPIINQELFPSFGLVDFSSKRFERPTSVLSSSKSDSVHRCLQPRLGSLSGRSFSVRSVDSRSFEGTHQHTRNEGSSSCTVSFSVPTAEQISGSSNGQHHCETKGTHCYELYLLAREILLLCNHLHLQIVVRHVPGKLNVLADALSRTLTPVNTEWELLQSVFQAITLQWGSPHVDLFATSLNYKVQVFMSPVPDPKAYAVDCMSVPWDGMFAYAFPPFRFLSQVLRKISAEQGLIILIAPAWPKQAWFPDLLHLSCARPLVLPYKCCFLLALASGRRRSEIHAFSTADYCLRFNRDKSSVTLLTDPAFLAKNQIPGRGSEPIVIPALPDDSSSKVLCPILVLLLYLQRTRSLRTSSNFRLLIPINKGKQDLSAKTISTWICKTIQLAYSFSNEELLNSMHVKAHDVTAISISWALFNNASLEEVLSAGFWRTENSFISHYLQSLATQAQSLYSLGPLVSAKRVVFPPASSGSGDSALC
ncbi:unnamed protein product [Mytilus edulis]|uniref:Reverse transcriptase domain-containing protein n=1 Tax=Mytilus edulis TaxID=6550 RepID=A0A8S3S8B4_MYTED|nr:unnamed protein product [Mytilus edulis]